MSADPVDDARVDPPYDGDEAAVLLGFVEWHRATTVRKTAGLDAAQLATTLPPSSMTLGGLLTHLAFVEDYWCSHVLGGAEPAEPWRSTDWDADDDADWHLEATPDERRRLLEETTARSREVVDRLLAGPEGLGSLGSTPRGTTVSLRWVLVHLVEEYARHNGHADLLREAVDGSVGE